MTSYGFPAFPEDVRGVPLFPGSPAFAEDDVERSTEDDVRVRVVKRYAEDHVERHVEKYRLLTIRELS